MVENLRWKLLVVFQRIWVLLQPNVALWSRYIELLASLELLSKRKPNEVYRNS